MQARLTVESGDCLPAVLELSPGLSVTLGRSRDNTLVLRDGLASRLHAKVFFEDGHWRLRDFGLNGTRLDGERISGGAELLDGLVIGIGEVSLRFSTSPSPNLDQTPAPSRASPPTHFKYRGESHQTKVVEQPGTREAAVPTEHLVKQRRMDELTALCKFMSTAVELKTPFELIEVALRVILHQTTARLAGYLSFDPDDPTPRIVLPEEAAVDRPLSRRLTQLAYQTGNMVWLFPELTSAHAPTGSLFPFADALCLPLKSSWETPSRPFAALHVYRSGRAFFEHDVRFIEAVAGYLARGLEILRNRRALEAENTRLRTHLAIAEEIIGESAAACRLRQQIVRAAPQQLAVLVEGESGSGKELVALAIHRNSRRAAGPLVAFNCAGTSTRCMDAELFGLEEGAAGNDSAQLGLIRLADEGTLFLDEVSELPLDCQAKLLRVIEATAFRPAGATKDLKADVRIVAATQRDLGEEVKAGRFRAELYSRLKAIAIRVPPLRERPEDIPELAAFFLARLSSQCRRGFRLAPAAIEKLQSYAWPGNIRQLRALLESAAVMSESDRIEATDLFLGLHPEQEEQGITPAEEAGTPLGLDMEEIETWAVQRALRRTGGNVSHAARLLGISRDTLHSKIKKKGIDREAFTSSEEPG